MIFGKHKDPSHKKFTLALVILTAVAVISAATAIYAAIRANEIASTSQPVTAAINGTIGCVPYKTSPSPMICALGLKTDGGKYYALRNLSSDATKFINENQGKHVLVRGTLSSPASNETYKIVGVIDVAQIGTD